MILKNIEEVTFSTDVLVIGGGLAGVVAAAKAADAGASVLVVEKGVTGWAGEVLNGGGYIMTIPPESSVDDFVEWVVESGSFLSDQEWTYAFGGNSYETIIKLAEWGLPFHREKDVVKIVPKMRYYSNVMFYPNKFMLSLKKAAASKGASFLDKVYVSDLIVQDEKVRGAVGVGVVDGKFYVMNAKAVIIATGGVRSKRMRGFTWCNGEGVNMAYQAGAKIINTEFLNHYIPFSKEWSVSVRQPVYYFYVNKKGEKVVLKHFPEFSGEMKGGRQREDQIKIVEAVAREIMAGNGPIWMDTSTATPEELSILRGTTSDFHILRQHKILPDAWELPRIKAGIDIEKDKIEIEPIFIGGNGPIRVDLECRTTVHGLWAVGDACAVGSGWAGARSTGTYPGVGMAFGMYSGLRAGDSAGRFARQVSKSSLDRSQVEMNKEMRYAPLNREKGRDYHDLIYGVHEVLIPMKYNFFRRGDRLQEALQKLQNVQVEMGQSSVKDSHGLVKLLETEASAVCAEMTLQAALMRTESRGSHKREDFPDRDDDHWLQWVAIKKRDGRMELEREPVPLGKYKFQPVK